MGTEKPPPVNAGGGSPNRRFALTEGAVRTLRRVVQKVDRPAPYGDRGRRRSSPVGVVNLWVVSRDANFELTCKRIQWDENTSKYVAVGDSFTVYTWAYDVAALDWTEVDPPIIVTTAGNQEFVPATLVQPQNDWYCLWRIIGTCD